MRTVRMWRAGMLLGGMIVVSGGCAADRVAMPAAPASVSPALVQVNILEAMKERVAGTDVASERPAETRIRICRIAGMQTAKPLVVIDGVVVGHGAGHEIDPATIESIELLRGLSAQRIYGPEARDGVILIRTKRPGTAPASDPAAR